jgi:hypothetical protein
VERTGAYLFMSGTAAHDRAEGGGSTCEQGRLGAREQGVEAARATREHRAARARAEGSTRGSFFLSTCLHARSRWFPAVVGTLFSFQCVQSV